MGDLPITINDYCVCDSDLQYVCGDTGPGGGTIYYASSTAFACGPDTASFCNYLEVAQNLWAAGSQSSCKSTGGGQCGGSATQTSDFAGSGKGITLCTGTQTEASINVNENAVGAGYANTMVLVPLCSSSDAPNIARAYDGGDMSDWFVPSYEEIVALYEYTGRNAIGGFPNATYWQSSSPYSNWGSPFSFPQQEQEQKHRNNGYGFRPVRAF